MKILQVNSFFQSREGWRATLRYTGPPWGFTRQTPWKRLCKHQQGRVININIRLSEEVPTDIHTSADDSETRDRTCWRRAPPPPYYLIRKKSDCFSRLSSPTLSSSLQGLHPVLPTTCSGNSSNNPTTPSRLTLRGQKAPPFQNGEAVLRSSTPCVARGATFLLGPDLLHHPGTDQGSAHPGALPPGSFD